MHVEEALFRSYLQNGNGLIELAFNGKLAHILPHRSESPRATTYPKVKFAIVRPCHPDFLVPFGGCEFVCPVGLASRCGAAVKWWWWM